MPSSDSFSTKSIAVYVADTSPLDCQLLAASLVRNRMRVTGWSTRSTDVAAGIARCKPDVALIAVRLEDGDQAGLNVLREAPGDLAQTRIVTLVDSSEPAVVVEAFRNGASGVFSREQLSGLSKCIRCVLAGQFWANNQQLQFVVEALREQRSSEISKTKGSDLLTRRERDVVTLVARGLTNRDIAEQLRLSEHTIKNYLLSIFGKIGVSTRLELALHMSARQNQRLADESEVSGENGSAARAA